MEGISAEFGILGQGLVALVLGGFVGWDREMAGKGAGLRTHMLVCFAAMFFVRIGELLIQDTQSFLSRDTLRGDPVRIIEAIVTGISFIGAGTVFRDRDRHMARGLTTAASLLTVAPIGVAVALNRYFLATGATALVFFVLRVLGKLEHKAGLPQHQTATRDKANETRSGGVADFHEGATEFGPHRSVRKVE